MQHNFTWQYTLEAAIRVNWKIEDLIGGDKRLDAFPGLSSGQPVVNVGRKLHHMLQRGRS